MSATASNQMDFFATDWAAMTLNDWIGTIMTVGVFILMVIAYVLILHPKNRDHLEAQRHLVDGPDGEAFSKSEKRDNE
ncbi:MAG: cbb3-type cytochrome c oxidase subunit 3 [Gammaproteobacteria bacterium]|nr:cbb3-type cytochrome c oxidase subunit 3 [Gammaproteobacteria bacterium]